MSLQLLETHQEPKIYLTHATDFKDFMKQLLEQTIHFFADWLEVSDTGKGHLEPLMTEMKRCTAANSFTPQLTETAEKWLPVAFAEDAPDHCQPLLNQLQADYQALRWLPHPNQKIEPDFKSKFTVCQLIGPAHNSVFTSDKIEVGFSIQAPEAFYPPHFHPAAEFYGILTGLSEWQIYYNRPMFHPPGAHIFHPSEAPHAMMTHDDPLLTIWAWCGDLGPATEIPANGWL